MAALRAFGRWLDRYILGRSDASANPDDPRYPRSGWRKLKRWLTARPWWILLAVYIPTVAPPLLTALLEGTLGKTTDLLQLLLLDQTVALVKQHPWVMAPILLGLADVAVLVIRAASDEQREKQILAMREERRQQEELRRIDQERQHQEEVRRNKEISHAHQTYLEKISAKYSTLALPFGPSKTRVALKFIFQPLKLRSDPLLAEDVGREERRALQDEPGYKEDGTNELTARSGERQPIIRHDRRARDQIARNGEEALSKSRKQRMIVLGGPGLGKTTLLRHLVREQAEQAMRDENALLPLFVSLSQLAVSGKTLKEEMMSQIQDLLVDERYVDILWQAIEGGHAFICLDGLDEVIERREDIIHMLNELAAHPGNICVVSSRFTHLSTGAYLDLEKFTLWELQPLDDSLRLNLANRLRKTLQQSKTTPSMALDPVAFIQKLKDQKKLTTWGVPL